METNSLTALAQEHLAIARAAGSGRSALTLFGGHEHVLRQTLLALAGGHSLSEHEGPAEATLQVLVGVVRLTAQSDSCEAVAGDIMVLPNERHALEALEDSVILLTVAQGL
jgi:quercetin dioxygenase-like cupin family protein